MAVARAFARAYLHHLVKSGETLGAMLLSEINIAYYQQLMAGIRDAIASGEFADFRERTRADWAQGDITPRLRLQTNDQLQANRLTECLVTKP